MYLIFTGEMAKRMRSLHGLQGHPLLIRVFEDLGNLILIVIESLFHEGLRFSHLPDAVKEVIEDRRRSREAPGPAVPERTEFPAPDLLSGDNG